MIGPGTRGRDRVVTKAWTCDESAMNPVAVIAVMACLTAGLARAEDSAGPAVVELYTSQGCSSCPPADSLLKALARRGDVIALGLHVDYWDYIGWKDTFGDPAFTARQKSYAKAMQERMVFTPQIIVNGTDSLVGSDAAAVKAALRPAGGPGAPALSLSRQGSRVRIEATTTRPFPDGAIVQLIRYQPLEEVAIERGENAGESIAYANIVTQWRKIGSWDGTAPLTITTDAPGPEPIVILIQTPGPGAILAAAALR